MTSAEKKRKGYPDNWEQLVTQLRERFGMKCERCKREHDPESGYCLTVHHLDNNPRNNADWNLALLCQRCHLAIQGRVTMNQDFWEQMLPVSDWFKPHYEGYKSSLKQRTIAP